MHKQEIQTEEEGPTSPFLIPEIVESLMENIDDKFTTLQARFVCQLWNQEAIKSIRNKIQRNEFTFRRVNLFFPLQSQMMPYLKMWQCVFDESEILDIFLSNSIVKLSSTSKRFSTSSSKINTLSKFWNHTGTSQKEMLSKYGSFAKEISILPENLIVNTSDLRSLVQLITECCPNIENMTINDPIEKLRVDETAFHFAENQTMLKLKHLQFSSIRSKENDTLIEKNLYVLLTLLKISPRLTSLDFESTSTLFWNRFYNELSTIPKIVLNLSEISLKGNILDLLPLFNDIKFGPNLTKVKFHNIFLRHHFQDDFVSQLQFFMKNVGINLKHLEFKQSKHERLLFQEMNFKGGPTLKIKDKEVVTFFPQMPLLKKFTTFFKFKSFKFLELMPNLTKLHLNKVTKKEFMLNNPIPSNRIQELTLSEFDCTWDKSEVFQKIFSSETIAKISLAFPNLIELYLELSPSTVLTPLGLKLWFENICKAISNMEHLKMLVILVCPSDDNRYEEKDLWDWYSQVNLEDGFGILKNTPNLQTLTLTLASIDSDGSIQSDDERQVHFPRAPLLQLLEAPKLTHLITCGLILDAIDISELEAFHERFFDRGIELTIYEL